MEAVKNVQSSLKELNEQLIPYMPPRNTWNPAHESLYKPLVLYHVPLEEAKNMQLKAIKYTFTHHYNNNEFYRKYCELRGACPVDIEAVDDLDDIPLIPDTTFKQLPPGKEFAHWLVSIFTGDLPVVIEGGNPSYDDVMNGFNVAGLVVMCNSGIIGRVTVIPRDLETFQSAEYTFAKLTGCMAEQTPHHVRILSQINSICYPQIQRGLTCLSARQAASRLIYSRMEICNTLWIT